MDPSSKFYIALSENKQYHYNNFYAGHCKMLTDNVDELITICKDKNIHLIQVFSNSKHMRTKENIQKF